MRWDLYRLRVCSVIMSVNWPVLSPFLCSSYTWISVPHFFRVEACRRAHPWALNLAGSSAPEFIGTFKQWSVQRKLQLAECSSHHCPPLPWSAVLTVETALPRRQCCTGTSYINLRRIWEVTVSARNIEGCKKPALRLHGGEAPTQFSDWFLDLWNGVMIGTIILHVSGSPSLL